MLKPLPLLPDGNSGNGSGNGSGRTAVLLTGVASGGGGGR
jgi:hypothetical protein